MRFKVDKSMTPARSRYGWTVLVLAAALIAPAIVLASHQFADVPTTSSLHDDVQAIAEVGVTTGCGGGNYCPANPVTRGQMAQFMNRLGALGPGATPVVNAKTALSAQNAAHAATADDAGAVDGIDSAALLTHRQIVSATTTMANGSESSFDVSCPPGAVPVGGGWDHSSLFDENIGPVWQLVIGGSYPTDSGWRVEWSNSVGTGVSLTVYAICVTQPQAQ